MKLRYVVPILAFALLPLSGSISRPLAAQAAPQHINVVAKRFTYVPAEITLKKGQPVVLSFTSQDVTHGIRFKELNLETKIHKGSPAELTFTPTQTGDFVGHCSNFCGAGHGGMMLTLHVTE